MSTTNAQNEAVTNLALASGMMTPHQVEICRETGCSPLDFIAMKSRASVAALAATKTASDLATATKTIRSSMTAGQLAACEATGCDPDEFARIKAHWQVRR